jgi:hypothetical protein
VNLPHHGHRLAGGDVEAGEQARGFGQAERLGHGLAGTTEGKATAHARCLLIAVPVFYPVRESTGGARPGS